MGAEEEGDEGAANGDGEEGKAEPAEPSAAASKSPSAIPVSETRTESKASAAREMEAGAGSKAASKQPSAMGSKAASRQASRVASKPPSVAGSRVLASKTASKQAAASSASRAGSQMASKQASETGSKDATAEGAPKEGDEQAVGEVASKTTSSLAKMSVLLPPEEEAGPGLDESDLSVPVPSHTPPTQSLMDTPMKKHHTMAQSGINLRTNASSTLVERIVSSVIHTVASTHAGTMVATALEVKKSSGLARSRAASVSAEAPLLERSLWKDPDYEEIVRAIRMDALGETLIWSKETSDTAVEGVRPMFDMTSTEIPPKLTEKRPTTDDTHTAGSSVSDDKDDQLLVYKEAETQSLKEHGVSREESMMTTVSFTQTSIGKGEKEEEAVEEQVAEVVEEAAEEELEEDEEEEKYMWEESKPSKTKQLAPPSKVGQPEQDYGVCRLDLCFDAVHDIDSKELSLLTIRSTSNIFPRDDVRRAMHLRFRLFTGHSFKRVYQGDVTIRDILRDLAKFLDVPNDSIALQFKNEMLDWDLHIREMCIDHRKELEVVANAVEPEHLISLMESGAVFMKNDKEASRFLTKYTPCVAKVRERRQRVEPQTSLPAVPPKFIPGLDEHVPGEATVSEELAKRLELDRQVKRIEETFRCYLSKRVTPPRTDQYCKKDGVAKCAAPQDAPPRKGAQDCKRKLPLNEEEFPKKRDFFTLLYNMLGEWWHHTAAKTRKNNSFAAKMTRMYLLLADEMRYMKAIEKHRSRLRDDAQMQHKLDLLDKLAAEAPDASEPDSEYDPKPVADGCEWEWLLDLISPWSRIKLLPELKEAVLDCHSNRDLAAKLCQLINCQHCRSATLQNKSIIDATLASDMRNIIKGCYPVKEDKDCRCYCYTCQHFRPASDFSLDTETARIYSCDQCRGLDNIARRREEWSLIRQTMYDVRSEELRRRTASWMPFIMQERDYQALLNMWHNASALTGETCNLKLVRWDPKEEWSPWNTILLTVAESRVHRKAAYGGDLRRMIRLRNMTAKWTFKNLTDSEEMMRWLCQAEEEERDGLCDAVAAQDSEQKAHSDTSCRRENLCPCARIQQVQC